MVGRRTSRSILEIILVTWLVWGCGLATATPTASPSAVATVGPGGFPRRFHVQGNAFVDQFGQTEIFRGLVAMDPVQQKNGPTNPTFGEHYYQVMASWGANIVRVPIEPFGIHRFGLGQTLDALDQAIRWAGQHHMYVDIDFHAAGWLPTGWAPPGQETSYQTSIAEWTNFWKIVSGRYAANDVVAFYEIYAEPALPWSLGDVTGPEYWMTWKRAAETLINDTIRPIDAHKTILVGGLMSAYDLEYVRGQPINDSAANVGYSTNPYENWLIENHLSWDTAFGDLSRDYAVFSTEYGYHKGYQNLCCADSDVGGFPYHMAIVDYLESHHISWTAWGFYGEGSSWGDQLNLLTNSQTFEASEEGAFWRGRLLALNFPESAPPELPTMPPEPVRPGNLALGKPATASSVEGDAYIPAYAVDGDAGTRWSSQAADPQWIQVDLGAVRQIHEVRLNWESSYAVDYTIQLSSDGAEWTTVYTATDGIGGIEDLTVSGSGRYVRMLGTTRAVILGASYAYSLYELEVY
jgi:endoglucanase